MNVPMEVPSSGIKLEAKMEKQKMYWIVTLDYSWPISYGVDDGVFLCGIFETYDEAARFEEELECDWDADPRAFCENIFGEDAWDIREWLIVDKDALPSICFEVKSVNSRQIAYLGGGCYAE